MQHPDEGTIHAWLDDALSAEESAVVETHVATCAECAAAVAEARGLIAASSRIVSALDIVPGGVIPRQATPVRPAWYSTTQFRAAAAVLFVAGASMLLVQGRDGGSVEELSQRAMSAPSSVEAETSQAQAADAAEDMAAAAPESDARATAPARLPSRPQVAGPGSPELRAQVRREAAADGAGNAPSIVQPPPPPVANMPLAKVSEGIAAGAAVGEAQRKAGLQESQQSARAPFSGRGLNEVVVTGVTAQSDAADMTVVRRDSTSTARRTVFLVEPGVTVSLTELLTGARTRTTARQLNDAAPSAASAPVAAPPPPVNQGRVSPVFTISWTDSATKNIFTLSGALPREKLEEIRKQIETRERLLRLKD